MSRIDDDKPDRSTDSLAGEPGRYIPRMHGRHTRLILVLSAAITASAHAQAAAARAGCYRFDRSYFGWVGRPLTGGGTLIDSASVIRLDSAAHPQSPGNWVPPDARAVAVPAMSVDSFTVRLWLGVSFWRAVSSDEIEIQWRNGLYGPVFRLAVRGDSLKGSVRFTTDVAGAEPPLERASATRVACPK